MRTWTSIARPRGRGGVEQVDGPLRWLQFVGKSCSSLLAADDFGGVYAFGGVSGVDYQLGLVDDGFVVVGGVVGDDDYGIVVSEVGERGVGHVEVVVAAATDGGKVGVVVGDDGALVSEEFDDGEGRRLAEVVDVALVGEAEDEDFRSLDGLALVVESGGDVVDDEVGHAGIDFAGEFDEAGAEVELLGFPGEVEGIDGDAMASEAGAGVEGLEAEGLGFGGVDDFVDVDAHAHAELLELVDERDVDAAVDVFKQLGHFSDGGAADADGAAEDGAIHGGGEIRGGLAASADHLGNVVAGDGVVAGVFALRGKDYVDAGLVSAASNLETVGVSLFEERDHDLFSGAGVSGALKHDELALMDMGGEGANGAGDEAEVGLVVFIERGGNADDDGVHLRDFGVVGGGGEA